MTEHLTGPYIANSIKIYRYRPDIWMGIMQRIIDDLDSNFYEVKLAIVDYYLALLEGLNETIVSFVSANIKIDILFD